MQITIPGNNGSTSLAQIQLTELPHKCPYCHKSIRPIPVYGYLHNLNWSVFMNCPDSDCRESFIGYYKIEQNQTPGSHVGKITYLHKTSFGRFVGKEFEPEIVEISPGFVKIYNESFAAEQHSMLEICGVGYRKSFEFLIKDYAKTKHPGKEKEIEKKTLSQCITDYVTDENVKSVAKRAVWLGNDETHYVKVWEGNNLINLKKLIDLTLHWIEAANLTEYFENTLPDPAKGKSGN